MRQRSILNFYCCTHIELSSSPEYYRIWKARRGEGWQTDVSPTIVEPIPYFRPNIVSWFLQTRWISVWLATEARQYLRRTNTASDGEERPHRGLKSIEFDPLVCLVQDYCHRWGIWKAGTVWLSTGARLYYRLFNATLWLLVLRLVLGFYQLRPQQTDQHWNGNPQQQVRYFLLFARQAIHWLLYQSITLVSPHYVRSVHALASTLLVLYTMKLLSRTVTSFHPE